MLSDMCADFVYLASQSPRRRELLTQIGVPFQLLNVCVDESVVPGENGVEYVKRVACAKASAGWNQCSDSGVEKHRAPVLAADTAVILDGEILGKPVDRIDARRMMRGLSGRTHEVLTAIALATINGVESCVSRSEVTFRKLAEAEVDLYWETQEPWDKAGAYAIQGRGAIFVAELRGSYSGVVGLPLLETADLLASAGVARWQ